MKNCITILSSAFSILFLLLNCSGGGADVGNPFYGTVMLQSSNGEPAAGARVVIAKRGADPGMPGLNETVCSSGGEVGIGFCIGLQFFDTVYTDKDGTFTFDDIALGEYVLHATSSGLCALEFVRQEASGPGSAAIVLTEPAMVKLRMYEPVDTAAGLHFKGARIAGTDIFQLSDKNGEVTFDNVPEGSLSVIAYRSDSITMKFDGLRTLSNGTAQLFALPSVDEKHWTARHCGPRYDLERPYVLESYIPLSGLKGTVSALDSGKNFTIRLRFSHDMDVVATSGAIKPLGDDSLASVETLWWEGGDALYIKLCVPDGSGICSENGNSAFKSGIIYGVTIDTTAQTALGVPFAYREKITFTTAP